MDKDKVDLSHPYLHYEGKHMNIYEFLVILLH